MHQELGVASTNAFEGANISFNPSAILDVTFPEVVIIIISQAASEFSHRSACYVDSQRLKTLREPQFSLCSNDTTLANSKQTFVLAMIDSDAWTNVSVAQGRHFLGGLTATLSDHIGPDPLAGQSPHRYIEFLAASAHFTKANIQLSCSYPA